MEAGTAHFTSPLAESLAEDVLARFVRYARVDTQSARDSDSQPSTLKQLDLSRMLVDELAALGAPDASLDDNGYVMATLPSTVGPDAPVVGLVAHVDTSPDAPGTGVEPIVHRGYDGGVIELPRAGTVLDPVSMAGLAGRAGHDIVTSSGDTLLGADDKAGVAEIMAALAHLAAHPDAPRPTLRVCFTPDEEVGAGATLFDIERFGAQAAYTIDGSELGELQDETFSAKEAVITIEGVDVHPGHATGKLVNAARLAGAVLAALPSDRLTPETTSGREGFIHVYEVSGTAGRAVIRAIVRDFDDSLLEAHVALLRQVASDVVASEPRARLSIEVDDQYPNMRRFLEPYPEIMAFAERAIRAEGIEPLRQPARGGTDGSILSQRGLPTPNVFAGGHEFHSVREWVSVQDMAAAAAVIVRLAAAWAEGPEQRQ
jgi:tripeptide aminopeptidase